MAYDRAYDSDFSCVHHICGYSERWSTILCEFHVYWRIFQRESPFGNLDCNDSGTDTRKEGHGNCFLQCLFVLRQSRFTLLLPSER